MKARLLFVAFSCVLFAKQVFTAPESIPECTAAQIRSNIPNGECETNYSCGTPPGTCEATYSCAGANGTVNVPIPATAEFETMNCEYAAVTYTLKYTCDGQVKSRCCVTGKPTEPVEGAVKDGPGTADDQKVLTGEGDGVKSGDRQGGDKVQDGEQKQNETCVIQKDIHTVVKLDEKDPTQVWACLCNEGEEPQLLPLSGATKAIPIECSDIHEATKTINQRKIKYLCNQEFYSDGKWKKFDSPGVGDCAGKCTSGTEGPCLGASYDMDRKLCYLAHIQPTWHEIEGWVSVQFVDE